MNEISQMFSVFVGTFTLGARDNFGNALGADCLLKKWTIPMYVQSRAEVSGALDCATTSPGRGSLQR